MSKEDKHIDNLFKEKLDGRSFDGPPADFLADLNQRLDEKAAVSRGWIWILFLNLFFIGLFVVNATVDFSSSKTVEVAQKIDNNEQNALKEESFKNDNDQKKNAAVERASASNTVENERENEKGDESENENESESDREADTGKSLTRVESSKFNSEGTETNTQNNVDTENDLSKVAESNNGGNSNKDNSSKSNNTSSTAAESNKDNTAEKNNVGKDTGDKEKTSNKTTEKEPNSEESTSNIEGSPMNNNQSLSSYVSYSEIYAPEFEEVDRKIKNNDFPEFPNPWSDLVVEDNSNVPEETPQQKDDDKHMFEIQLQGGATRWGFNTLGTNENYVAELDQSGTPKWTPNFGLGFHANFNNVSIGTGIDYAKFKTENLFQFGEVTSYDSTYIAGYNQTYTYDSLGNIIDSTNTPYYDSTTVTDTTYNTTAITNQYEWIQIPLHIGYRFNLNKWAIIPRAGLNIGLGIRQSSGQYPNEAYDDLQTLSPVKWNLNLHTSLEVRRDFGRWHAFGKFNYQRNLTPTIDNVLFERKFSGVGFNFGVGYSF